MYLHALAFQSMYWSYKSFFEDEKINNYQRGRNRPQYNNAVLDLSASDDLERIEYPDIMNASESNEM